MISSKLTNLTFVLSGVLALLKIVDNVDKKYCSFTNAVPYVYFPVISDYHKNCLDNYILNGPLNAPMRFKMQ